MAQKADFRTAKQKELDELNGKIDDLRAKAQNAKPEVKAQLAAALDVVNQRKAGVDAELRTLESSTASDLEKTKDRIDQQIALFKESVREAEKRI